MSRHMHTYYNIIMYNVFYKITVFIAHNRYNRVWTCRADLNYNVIFYVLYTIYDGRTHILHNIYDIINTE